MNDKELQNRTKTYEKEIIRLQARIAESEAQLQHLHRTLAKQQNAKEHIRGLYANLDSAIIKMLDKKGYDRKKRLRSVTFPSLELTAHSKSDLMTIAWTYDVKKFFQYRGLRDNMKFQYRVVSKIYRVSRDVSKKSAKKAYLLIKKPRQKRKQP